MDNVWGEPIGSWLFRQFLESSIQTESCWNYPFTFLPYPAGSGWKVSEKFRRLSVREKYYIQENTGYRCCQHSSRLLIPYSDTVVGCQVHSGTFSWSNIFIFTSSPFPKTLLYFLCLLSSLLRRRRRVRYPDRSVRTVSSWKIREIIGIL